MNYTVCSSSKWLQKKTSDYKKKGKRAPFAPPSESVSGFLVEATNIENTSFPFKTALSEPNIKTNRMATTKWTYHKDWSFASNYFIFLENLCQF